MTNTITPANLVYIEAAVCDGCGHTVTVTFHPASGKAYADCGMYAGTVEGEVHDATGMPTVLYVNCGYPQGGDRGADPCDYGTEYVIPESQSGTSAGEWTRDQGRADVAEWNGTDVTSLLVLP